MSKSSSLFVVSVALGLCACDFNSSNPPTPVPEPSDEVALPSRPVLPNRPVISSDTPLPPISGGTLLVTTDDRFAIAADPDRDQVHIVDLITRSLAHDIALTAGDEPGRVAEGPNGHAFVALRRGGAVAEIDPSTGQLVRRFAVCRAPRGLAFDSSTEQLHVACADGQLVSFDAAGNETRRLELELDLRDVVIGEDALFVTRFRSAELLMLDRDSGTLRQRIRLDPRVSFEGKAFSPSVAWRAVSDGAGGAIVLHQMAQDAPVVIEEPGGYGDGTGCGIVVSSMTRVRSNGSLAGVTDLTGTTLAVDLAVHPQRPSIVVASPAEIDNEFSFSGSVSEFPDVPSSGSEGLCFGVFAEPVEPPGRQFVGVAYTSGGERVSLSRDPPIVKVGDDTVAIAQTRMVDTGSDIFHMNSGAGIACASCHPEGGDDSHVWTFDGLGPRRTQTIAGGLLGSEPFHWSGDMPDLGHLLEDVFQRRMGGGMPDPAQIDAVGRWLDRVQAVPAPRRTDDPLVLEGKAIFERGDVGCASCHSGKRKGGTGSFDVGTGEILQVPPLLGVAYRAPFIHNGCAPTLADRFSPCGGGDRHGHTSQLDQSEIEALVAYLESL